jgi:hypothetical protein
MAAWIVFYESLTIGTALGCRLSPLSWSAARKARGSQDN